MSQFCVIVIGDDPEKQLAPYHEFECTGRVDEYVQSVDITDEVRSAYESGTRAMVILPVGEAVSAYDDRFYRDPTPEEADKIGSSPDVGFGFGGSVSWVSKDWGDGQGCRPKVHDTSIVPGAEEKDLPYSEIMTFTEFIEYGMGEQPIVQPGSEPDLEGEHKWGWIEVDDGGEIVKVIDRTNPNHKWDWYGIGGRWTGYFPLKDGAVGGVGSPGLMTPRAPNGWADQCKWHAVDIERARDEAGAKAHKDFDLWVKALGYSGTPPISFAEALERHTGPDGVVDRAAARKMFNEQPAIAGFDRLMAERGAHFGRCPVSSFGLDRDAYVARQRASALVPFAIVKDGSWIEKGEMHFWGATINEMSDEDWYKYVAEIFDELEPGTLVTAVDCHV